MRFPLVLRCMSDYCSQRGKQWIIEKSDVAAFIDGIPDRSLLMLPQFLCAECLQSPFIVYPAQPTKQPTKQRPGDQPLPTKNDQPHVADVLCEFIQGRKKLGIERYGTPLQPHNGRNALMDAFEESVDLASYLLQKLMEEGEIV